MSVRIANGGRKVAAAAAVFALLGTSAAVARDGDASAPKGGAGCKGSSEPAVKVPEKQLRKAIHCLINAERDQHGRSSLDKDKHLAKAARKHTKRMVQTNCLDHQCGGEASLENRIRSYIAGASAYDYAEDVGCATTAQKMVSNWMSSSLHRDNLLGRKFNDIGVGASHGRVPSQCSDDYATFTVVFGFRKG